MADTKTSALASLGTPVGADYVFGVLASGPTDKKLLLSDLRKYTSQNYTPGGRLTLESGVPVSTTDQTAKTTIYYTPYIHNLINLWDGANWAPTEFTEKTLALGTITSAKPYDVFGYLSAGALVLELLAWTSDTARATAVTLQDGRYCKSGDKTRLLLGTFYTTATTTTEDSAANRLLWNVYNQVSCFSVSSVGTSHTMSASQAEREWNAGTGSPTCTFVVGLPRGQTFFGTYRAGYASGATHNESVTLALDGTKFAGVLQQFYWITTPTGEIAFNMAASFAVSAGRHAVTIREQNHHSATSRTYDDGLVHFSGMA